MSLPKLEKHLTGRIDKKRLSLGGYVACLLAFLVIFTIPYDVLAQTFSLDLGTENAGTVTGRIVQMVLVLTVITLAPGILMMMTCFTRIIIVLSFLRTAMGVQSTPPNQVVVSLALFLTFFIMSPTLNAAYEQGVQPLINEEIDEVTAFERAVDPFKEFMLSHVREKDLLLFSDMDKSGPYESPMATPLHVLVPAFMISELRRAFEIGFMLFLPFLIIDIVTASVLMSMGMMMLPPIIISLPFKIIFFVLIDGWFLITGSLVESFAQSTITPTPGDIPE